MSKNLAEFLAAYNPNDEHKLVTIDVPSDPTNDSPFILVRYGKYAAIINPSAVQSGNGTKEHYLDIDIHSFVDGEDGTASVFGMTTGLRHETGWSTGYTSEGRPSAHLVVVIVGEQAVTE